MIARPSVSKLPKSQTGKRGSKDVLNVSLHTGENFPDPEEPAVRGMASKNIQH
jgi:hypothetical protein